MASNSPFIAGCLTLLILTITGCGENSSPDYSKVSTLEASQKCIGCHSTAVSHVTGEAIGESWKLSSHNTSSSHNKTGRGAGCADCHEPLAGHPNICDSCHGGGAAPTRDEVVRNPDSALKCDKCHALTSTVHPLDRKHINPRPLHFTNYTASYLSSRFIGKCRSCHNPHNPTGHMETNREWSESGHGHYTAKPWNYYDFKTRGSNAPATPANSVQSDCIRCHTTTGYINYVTSGFTNISSWGKQNVFNKGTAASPNNYNTIDTTKQVLACPACHDDGNGNSYSFITRQVSPVTGYYNYSSPQTKKMLISFPYPDLSTSNICVACHSGREVGATVFAAGSGTVQSGINASIKPAWGSVNFRNVGFVNSHYLTAGATVFGVSGYQFAGRTYNNPLFEHNRIGMGNYKGTGTKGPCVTCHMTSSTKHRFLPVTRGEDKWSDITGVISTACNTCHPSPLNWTAATLQERKAGYEAAMEALRVQLMIRNFHFFEANPYIYATSNNVATKTNCSQNIPVKNWLTGGSTAYGGSLPSCTSTGNNDGIAGTGQNNMGAAFNFNMLEHDPGAFAHNSHYVKRLIYDSIDWLDDNSMNDSVGTTLNALDPVTNPYRDHALQYLLH